jgi:hypothetical protein
MDTQNRSLFISSCTRRQMARRRGTRTVLPIQVLVAGLLLAVAAGTLIALRGGL